MERTTKGKCPTSDKYTHTYASFRHGEIQVATCKCEHAVREGAWMGRFVQLPLEGKESHWWQSWAERAKQKGLSQASTVVFESRLSCDSLTYIRSVRMYLQKRNRKSSMVANNICVELDCWWAVSCLGQWLGPFLFGSVQLLLVRGIWS